MIINYLIKYLEGGTPLLDLHLPVEHHGGGDDDEVRAPHALLAGEVREEGDGLDGLAEPHLVGEDPVEEALVQRHQPVEADVLVLAQRVLQQERHRRLHRRRVEGVARGLDWKLI